MAEDNNAFLTNIRPEIQDTLEARQSSAIREQSTWFKDRTPWIRMSSMVSVGDGDDKEDIRKQNILFSGTSSINSDNNGMIILQESNRTDSLITNEFQISNDSSTVTTSYDITKVVGVFLSSDIAQVGINYATDNNFNGRIITLNTPLPQKIGVIVTYNKNAIKNYTLLSNNLFTKTGFDDLRFTIEVQITQPFLKYGTFKYGTTRWGQLANELTGTLGQLIDTAKATGIKASVVLVTKGTFYGADDAIYAQCWYGGSYY